MVQVSDNEGCGLKIWGEVGMFRKYFGGEAHRGCGKVKKHT